MCLMKKYIIMNFKRSMQYRLHFLVYCISIGPIHLVQMIFSLFIAERFNGFGDWSGLDLVFLYSVLLISYGIAQVFARTLRILENQIISGNFDVYFVKPQPILYSVIFAKLHITELFSQLLPPILIFVIVCILHPIQWSVCKILVLFGAIVGGSLIQMAIFTVIGCVSFWTMKSNNLENIFYAFKDFLNYPIYVYGKKIVAFLTYIFPLAFINYYPTLYILEKENATGILNFLTLPVGILCAGIALLFWEYSVKHYNSAGS